MKENDSDCCWESITYKNQSRSEEINVLVKWPIDGIIKHYAISFNITNAFVTPAGQKVIILIKKKNLLFKGLQF